MPPTARALLTVTQHMSLLGDRAAPPGTVDAKTFGESGLRDEKGQQAGERTANNVS